MEKININFGGVYPIKSKNEKFNWERQRKSIGIKGHGKEKAQKGKREQKGALIHLCIYTEAINRSMSCMYVRELISSKSKNYKKKVGQASFSPYQFPHYRWAWQTFSSKLSKKSYKQSTIRFLRPMPKQIKI